MPSTAAFAETAALVGDPARANMLAALMDGRALTAAELARAAGVAPQTASGHLAKLAGTGPLAVQRQGRHRYHRLASPAVARMLEGITAVTASTCRGPARPAKREAPTGNAPRRASAGGAQADASPALPWPTALDRRLAGPRLQRPSAARAGAPPLVAAHGRAPAGERRPAGHTEARSRGPTMSSRESPHPCLAPEPARRSRDRPIQGASAVTPTTLQVNEPPTPLTLSIERAQG